MTDEEFRDLLDDAASLLDSVGADRERVSAEGAPQCLHGAELLEEAGGRAGVSPMVDEDPRTTIRAAMTALSRLNETTFASAPVIDAARAARQALRRLG